MKKRLFCLVLAGWLTFFTVVYPAKKAYAVEWTAIPWTAKAIVVWLLTQSAFTWLGVNEVEKTTALVDDIFNKGAVTSNDFVNTADGRIAMEMSDDLVNRIEGYTGTFAQNPVLETKSDYQHWTNLPDSPKLTVEYPYQCTELQGGITYLVLSKGSIYTYGTGLKSEAWSDVYKLSNDAWIYVGGVTAGIIICDINVIECNRDIYTNNSLNDVWKYANSPSDTYDYSNNMGDDYLVDESWVNTPTDDRIVLKDTVNSIDDVVADPAGSVSDTYGITGSIDDTLGETATDDAPPDEITGFQWLIKAVKALPLTLWNTILTAVESALEWAFVPDVDLVSLIDQTKLEDNGLLQVINLFINPFLNMSDGGFNPVDIRILDTNIVLHFDPREAPFWDYLLGLIKTFTSIWIYYMLFGFYRKRLTPTTTMD